MRIAVIGCGHWGKNYVRILDQTPGVRVAGVADLDAANLAFVRQYFREIATTADSDELLRDARIDAVVVATPASSHYAIAMRAIEQGKHVIVEKPLALDTAECERLTEAAAARGLVLLVSHTFLYNDSIRKIKEVIQQEETGDVYYMTARRNHLGKIREDVGVLWDLRAHDISIFSYLLDREPEAVCAVGGAYLRPDREDVVFATLFYPGGVIGNVQASWVDASKIRELVVITGKRRIEFDDLDNLESVRIYDKGISIEQDVSSFGEFQYRLRDGDILSPRLDRREPLKNLCDDFLACVAEGKAPLSDGMRGVRVVRVLQGASLSMAQGGRKISL